MSTQFTLTLPPEVNQEIITKAKNQGFILTNANVVSGNTRGNQFIIDKSAPKMIFQENRGDVKAESDLNFGTKVIPAVTGYIKFRIPTQSLSDSQYLYDVVIEKLPSLISNDIDRCASGFQNADNSLYLPPVAGMDTLNTSYDTKDDGTVVTSTIADITVNDVDDLIDAEVALGLSDYDANGYWLSKVGRGTFMKMKNDDGSPVFGNYQTGGLGTVLGVNAVANNNINTALGFMGDWTKCIVPIADQITIKTYPHLEWEDNTVGVKAEVIYGIGIADMNAFRRIVAEGVTTTLSDTLVEDGGETVADMEED